jgi:hypothetical protein
MDKPLFIMGTPRSGTTLTATILNGHSRIFIPGETHFFEDVFARYKDLRFDAETARAAWSRLMTIYGRFNEPTDQLRVDALAPLLAGAPLRDVGSTGDLFALFMEAQMRHEGKRRWGNQTPRDIFYVSEILSLFPDAKIIVCIRDPRDFLLSYKNKWKREMGKNSDRLRKLYHPVVTSLLWKASMKCIPAIVAAVPKANLSLLRYERLVSDPETVIRELCGTIEETFEPGMLQIDFHNSSHGVHAPGIYGDSVGRWRSGLPREDIHIVQSSCCREMDFLGYAREDAGAGTLRVAHCYLSAPGAFLSALHANREKRGPLLPYLIRRGRSALLR